MNVQWDEQRVWELIRGGNSCSQTVLLYFAETFGLTQDQAKGLAKAFEGGMFRGETCGSVSAAHMVLGLAFADWERSAFQTLLENWCSRFEERMCSRCCEDLLGINIQSQENLKEAWDSGRIMEVCPKTMLTAIELLVETLNEETPRS